MLGIAGVLKHCEWLFDSFEQDDRSQMRWVLTCWFRVVDPGTQGCGEFFEDSTLEATTHGTCQMKYNRWPTVVSSVV